MPLNPQEYDLMVVSDLHLSEGRDADTKKFSLNEDFFFDEEFARLLDYQMHRIVGRPRERKWHLIINGDFLDFLQVVSTGIEREFLAYLHVNTQEEALRMLSFDKEHRGYGFGCGPRETVYKLWKIMNGHWIFFEALADFVAEGNVVTIGRGNHDVEFIYPEVQKGLAPKLRRMYDDKLSRESDPERSHKLDLFDQALEEERIRFMDWFYYEEGLIWVEHGNQYDEANTFKYWLCPQLPAIPNIEGKRKDEIDLPWGSFFVRYLFNKVEQKEPFADNIKPQTNFIAWFLTRHPLMALGFLFGGYGRYMLKKMARAFKFVPEDAYGARREEHLKRLRQLEVESGIPEGRLLSLDSQRAASVLREPHGVWKLTGILTRHWRISLTLLFIVLVLAVIGAILVFSHLFSPLIPHQVQNLLRIPLSHWPWILGVLTGLRWPLLVLVAVAVCWFVLWLLGSDKSPKLCYLVDRAKKVRAMFGVRYVTMGHTHDSDLQSIGSQGQEYFNTGTWTKVFSQEEQLLRDPSELLVLQGIRRSGGMSVKLLQWEDGAREPRLVRLFGASPDEASTVLQLSATALSEIVEKKATCPFLGTAVATGQLPVRNEATNPLASIEDVRMLGNTGDGDLGNLLVLFADGNHAFMRGRTGRLDQPVPNGLFSLELPGSQGSHPGHSGILQGDPEALDSGRLSQTDFARLASRAQGGLLKRSDVGRFIAENLQRDPKAKVFGLRVTGLLARDLGHFVVSVGPDLLTKLGRSDEGGDSAHRDLEQKLTRLLGEDNLVGSAGEFGLMFAFLANKPGAREVDGEPAVSLEDLRSMFLDKRFPNGWKSWRKTRLDWVINTTSLMVSAGKEYLALQRKEEQV